jgi:hypothetical protein
MVFLAVAMQLAVASPADRCEPAPCPGSLRQPVRARASVGRPRFPSVRPSAGEWTVGPSVVASAGPADSAVLSRSLSSALPVVAPTAGMRFVTGSDGQQLFEYSDGYYARLSLHRLASYGTLPLFALQFFSGRELLNNVDHAAGWARAVHGPAAAGVAGLFLVNTVTGGLNIVEGLRDPNDRGRRIAHSLLMLTADAGFVWTGVTASGAGRFRPDSNQLRTQHRTVALGSMAVATLGYLMMISPFRHD